MEAALQNPSDEISLKEIFNKIKGIFFFLLSQWWKILLVGIAGASIGYYRAASKPLTYAAKVSFVVEEAKSGGTGLSSLAGQFGIDFASSSGGSGLFYGENLLLFLKSRNLSKEVLLSPYDSARNYSLADKYADQYNLRKNWAKNKSIGTEIYFPSRPDKPFTRLQDSLLQGIISNILATQLLVERLEKKATFINVESSFRDELLSKYYCERLVQKAAERYVQSKIKRQRLNVERLQLKADSIVAALNNKTFSNAADQERILDVNPGSRTTLVNAEVSMRDKTILATIYGEVVKNLEISKMQLTQETPTIQVVDDVALPLRIVKVSKLLYLVIGGLIGGILVAVILVVRKFFKKV